MYAFSKWISLDEFYISGFEAKRMTLEEDLTVLIDYEKYQERTQNRRFQRQINSSNKTNQSSARYPSLYQSSNSQAQDKIRDHRYDCDDKGISKRILKLQQN